MGFDIGSMDYYQDRSFGHPHEIVDNFLGSLTWCANERLLPSLIAFKSAIHRCILKGVTETCFTLKLNKENRQNR